jgi:hypothetical protein
LILIKEKTDANNRKEMKKETRKMTRMMMMMILAGDAPSRTAGPAGPAEGQQAYNSTVPLLHGIGFLGFSNLNGRVRLF